MSPLLYRNTLLVGITRDTNGDNEIMNTSIDKTSKPTNGINEQTGNPGKEITKMNDMNITDEQMEANNKRLEENFPGLTARLKRIKAEQAAQVAGLSDDVKAAMADVGYDLESRCGFPSNWTEGDFWEFARSIEKRKASTVDEIWLGEDGPDDEEPEGTSVPVMRTGTTRADYDPDEVKALTACKRDQHGRVFIREYSDTDEEFYDLYENTRLPKVPEADVRYVHYGDTARYWATDRIRDDEGPLPGSNWRVVVHAGDDYGAGYKSSMWTSDQIVPTGENLVEKVDKYLAQTGDFHTFLEDIHINHTERTLAVSLGS